MMQLSVEKKWIFKAEEKLHLTLPNSYKTFISNNNGGKIYATGQVWRLYPIMDKSNKNRIKKTCNDMVYETEFMQKFSGFPAGGIAIAANDYGDRLILLPNENEPNVLSDKIYYWNHETGEVESVINCFELIFIAL